MGYKEIMMGMNRQARRSKMLNSFKTKTLGKCINVAAKDWQLLVRLRAADDHGLVTCVTCKKRLHYQSADAGHFYPRQHRSVIFHPWNCHPQCVACNRHGNSMAFEYGQFMMQTYGEKGIDMLAKIRNETKVWTREDLVELRLGFLDEIRQISQNKFRGKKR